MPDNFAQSPEGFLYVTNGQDDPAYWNGSYTTFRDSGIVAPATAPAMSGSGSGNVVGRFYAYMRYVDDLGNFSNLSPISTLYEPASSPFTISNVEATSPIRVTTGGDHGLIDGQQVLIKDVKGCTSANGVYTVTRVDGTRFTLDNSAPNGVYTGDGTYTTGVETITYSSLELPQDPKVARRQILRNKDGNTTVFYIDLDTTDLSSTSLSSTKSSLDLSDPVALFDDTGVDNAVAIYSPMPDFKAAIAHLKGRMFAMVDEDADDGCVSVTQGSTSVTGIGTQFRPTHVGRYLQVPGQSKIEIASVTSDTSLTLSDPYLGATDAYANYVIRNNDSEDRTMYWSLPNLPEAWPDDATRTLQEDPGSGRMTGLLPLAGFLFLLAQNRIYRFTYATDPATDSSVPVAVHRGTVNNRVSSTVDGVAFLLDSRGIHAFTGSDSDPRIGDAVEELFNNNPTVAQRINWSRQRYFHAVADHSESVIRWFVCLDGNRYPHHALCLHYRSGRWWTEEFTTPIASSCVGYINGRSHVFLGTRCGRVLEYDKGSLDGVDPGLNTVTGSVTSAGSTWITSTSGTFSTALVGWPVTIISGRGKGQTRTIWKVSSTTLYVRNRWSVQPDSTSTYQLGGINFSFRSLWFSYAESSDESYRGVSVQITPNTTDTHLAVRYYEDFSDTPVNQGVNQTEDQSNGVGTISKDPDITLQTTKSNAFFQHRSDRFRIWGSDGPRFLSVRVGGTSNSPERLGIKVIRVDGVIQ